MELNSVTLQIALLALPGLIWAMLDAAHRPISQRGQFEFIIRVFVFGAFTYFVTGLAYSLGPYSFDVGFSDSGDFDLANCIDEILWAIAWSVLFAVLWSYGRTYKVVTRFLQWIRATNHIGDSDIWEYLFNSTVPAVKFVNFRDFAQQLVYTGYAESFSDRGDLRELIITDVQVFNFAGDHLFSVPRLYLARRVDDITIEFPAE